MILACPRLHRGRAIRYKAISNFTNPCDICRLFAAVPHAGCGKKKVYGDRNYLNHDQLTRKSTPLITRQMIIALLLIIRLARQMRRIFYRGLKPTATDV